MAEGEPGVLTQTPSWCRVDPNRQYVRLSVHLQPGAKTTGCAGSHGEALKIRVAAPATEQRANRMLLQFLSESLCIAANRLRIVRGEKSRDKVIEIAAPDDALIASLRGLQ